LVEVFFQEFCMTNHMKDGLVEFTYLCDELNQELTCWFEYEAEERGQRSRWGEQLSPDYPATFSLHHVYLPGSSVDLAPVLSADVVEMIENWVVGQAQQEVDDTRADAAIDRWLDWQDSQ
jgi:hypothetical protein